MFIAVILIVETAIENPLYFPVSNEFIMLTFIKSNEFVLQFFSPNHVYK